MYLVRSISTGGVTLPGAEQYLRLVGRHAVGLLVVPALGLWRPLGRRLVRLAPLAGGRLVEHLYGALASLAYYYARVLEYSIVSYLYIVYKIN